jgi:adenylate cyclase class IV
MDTEFEAKFYPVNKEEYRQKLQEIGAELTIPERKMRRTMADKRAYPALKCDFVRVRDESTKITMTAKIHAEEGGSLGDQKETEIVVSDFDKAVEIMQLMGLEPNRYQETLRETWEYDGAEIVIDTWPCLEPYTEIEAGSEEKVREVAEKLGFNWDAKIILAAPEIMAKVYGLSIDEVLDKVSNITFENNPFAGLTRRAWKDIIVENK